MERYVKRLKWAAPAGRSWDKAVIPGFRPVWQVLPRADIQRLLNRPRAAAATEPIADGPLFDKKSREQPCARRRACHVAQGKRHGPWTMPTPFRDPPCLIACLPKVDVKTRACIFGH